MSDDGILTPPRYIEEKNTSGCKIIFMKDQDEGYCVLPSEIEVDQKNNAYMIKGPNILVDSLSYKKFIHSDNKSFVAIVKKGNIYVLSPLEKNDKKEFRDYEEPTAIGSGSYGKVIGYNTERIASKKLEPRLTVDVTREIAFYQYFYKLSCIPKLLDFDLGDISINIKMELGKMTLHKLMDRDLSPEETKTIIFRIIKCMAVISSQGFIHNDLKPENCIVGFDGSVKIIDWGMVEFDPSKDQTRLRTMECRGTPTFRSPEKWLDIHHTHKSDIFSIGLILLEMSTNICLTDESSMSSYTAGYYGLLGEEKAGRLGDLVSGPSISHKIKEFLQKTNVEDDLADLLSKMLEANPEHRISYREIIIHPYFQTMKRERIDFPRSFVNNMPEIKDIDILWEKSVGVDTRNKIISALFRVGMGNNCCLDTICGSIQLIDILIIKKLIIKKEDIMMIFGYALILCSNLYEFTERLFLTAEKYSDKILFKILEGNIMIPTLYSYWSRHYGELPYFRKNSMSYSVDVDVIFPIFMKHYQSSDIYSESFSLRIKKMIPQLSRFNSSES